MDAPTADTAMQDGRELLHLRDIALRGYRRQDGLYDIEARLADTKTYAFANQDRGTIRPGENLHGMWLRVTVDEDLLIHAAAARTEQGPFAICPAGADTFGRLAGLRIRPGFLKAANERLGGVQGCTHLRELLQQVATVAIQTLFPVRARRDGGGETGDAARGLINTCHAYAADGPVVARRWPELAVKRAAEAPP